MPGDLKTYVYSPLRKETNIRLIWLVPGEPDERIALSVFEALLSHGPSSQSVKRSEDEPTCHAYIALSYVWGDASNKVHVTVNGCDFEITRNLHQFLQHARDNEARKGPYWIDAVCINQRDDEEKGAQVDMMDRIYSWTERCIVWLGLEEYESRLAFELLQGVEDMVRSCHADLAEMDDSSETTKKKTLTKHDLFSELVNSRVLEEKVAQKSLWGPLGKPFSAPFSTESWNAVAKLFLRPWFHRSWTVQEFILPSNIELHCGTDVLDSWTLMTFNEVFGIVFHGFGYPPIAGFAQAFSLCSVVCSPRMMTHELGGRVDLLTAVAVHKRKGATDARDKIFAHLGSTGNSFIKADYSKSAAEIYHQFAVMHINKLRQLFILKQDLLREIKDLPSWVPDWSAPRPQQSCITYAQYKMIDGIDEHARAGLSSDNRSIFMSGKDEHVQARLSINQQSLFIKGILFDTIKDTHFIDLAVLQPHGLEGVKELVAGDTIFCHHFQPLEQSTVEILARTLMCDLMLEGDKPPLRASPPSERSIFDLREGYTYQTHYIEDRVLIITERGYMGLAPTDSQRGDVVCVLEGLEMPLVMRWRELDGWWEMIGAAYCHGIMDTSIRAHVASGETEIQEFEIR